MVSTSVTLLDRLKDPADQWAWQRFVDLYTPLLLAWMRRAGLQDSDAADTVQEVMCLLLDRLPEFEYDPKGSFRGWLRTLALNKLRDRFRQRELGDAGEGSLASAVDPHDLSEIWDREYLQHLTASALRIMQAEFEPTTWKACWEHIVSGKTAAQVGRELGMSEGAVHVAKSRVLKRLRQELKDLLD